MPTPTEKGAARGITLTSDKAIWFGCGDAICRLQQDRLAVWSAGEGVPARMWDSLAEDRAGNLWVRSQDLLLILRPGARRFVPGANLPHAHTRARLYKDREGNLWVPNDEGVAVLRDSVWTSYSTRDGLPANSVATMYQDREGGIWLGFGGVGLARWRGYGEWTGWSAADGLGSDRIWSVTRDLQGGLWAGTDEGLALLAPGESRWKRQEIPVMGKARVGSLAVAPDGVIWVGATPGGLFRLAPLDCMDADNPLDLSPTDS